MRDGNVAFVFCVYIMIGLVFTLLQLSEAYNLTMRDIPSISPGASSTNTALFSLPTLSRSPIANDSDFDFKKHFCRVWRHASTPGDGVIWLDGGNTYIPNNDTSFYNTPNTTGFSRGMNTFLFSINLSKNFTNQDTFPYTTHAKPGHTPNSLIEHALWYSSATRRVYQVGGWFSMMNTQSPVYVHLADIPEPSIWSFNADTGDDWAQTKFNSPTMNRPGAAAYCDAPTLNRSFIFEGYVQQRSGPEFQNFTPYSDLQYLEGMLALDTSGLNASSNPSDGFLTNITVPQYMGPRMNGAMVHIPIGEKGIIINIGGQSTNDPTPFGVKIVNGNAGNSNINMTFVDVYDVLTGYWFRQETFGNPNIPSGRSDICTVLLSAADNSSHHIIVIAGVDSYNGMTTFAEWWALSIPTFIWTKVFTEGTGRYGHTCHLVGENLLIIGGMETKSTDGGGDVDHCEAHMPVEIFSLPELAYTGVFDAEGAKRAPPIPQAIVDTIGGDRYGGAYLNQPKVWSDLYLQYVLNPSIARPAYTPSYTLVPTESPPASSNTNDATQRKNTTAALVCGVVAAAVILVAVGLCGFVVKKRKQQSTRETKEPATSPAQLDGSNEILEAGSKNVVRAEKPDKDVIPPAELASYPPDEAQTFRKRPGNIIVPRNDDLESPAPTTTHYGWVISPVAAPLDVRFEAMTDVNNASGNAGHTAD